MAVPGGMGAECSGHSCCQGCAAPTGCVSWVWSWEQPEWEEPHLLPQPLTPGHTCMCQENWDKMERGTDNSVSTLIYLELGVCEGSHIVGNGEMGGSCPPLKRRVVEMCRSCQHLCVLGQDWRKLLVAQVCDCSLPAGEHRNLEPSASPSAPFLS